MFTSLSAGGTMVLLVTLPVAGATTVLMIAPLGAGGAEDPGSQFLEATAITVACPMLMLSHGRLPVHPGPTAPY